MKHFLSIQVPAFFFLCCLGCGSPSGAVQPKANEKHNTPRNLVHDVDNPSTSTLLDMLRGEPGLEVRYVGGEVAITIRGVQFIHGDNNPLYVLDGVPLGRNYKDVADTIDVHTITSIRVFKGSRAAIWGSRGANGVIVIKTRSI